MFFGPPSKLIFIPNDWNSRKFWRFGRGVRPWLHNKYYSMIPLLIKSIIQWYRPSHTLLFNDTTPQSIIIQWYHPSHTLLFNDTTPQSIIIQWYHPSKHYYSMIPPLTHIIIQWYHPLHTLLFSDTVPHTHYCLMIPPLAHIIIQWYHFS